VVVEPASVDDADFPDGSFDTIVSTLVLCTVPDPAAAAARIRGWLAPGGRLLYLEHVRSPGWWSSHLQRAITPLWTVMVAGCHLDRDTLGALRGAGFLIADCDRFAMPVGGTLMRTCVAGMARPLTLPEGAR
jgi:SAM-dependent methyltransferase